MKIRIQRPSPTPENGAEECLLGTPRYDFNWQRVYPYAGAYEELPTLATGDTMRFTCTYDNTMSNPYIRQALTEKSLSSPVDISLGETTLDEMCLGVLVVIRPVPPVTPAPPNP